MVKGVEPDGGAVVPVPSVSGYTTTWPSADGWTVVTLRITPDAPTGTPCVPVIWTQMGLPWSTAGSLTARCSVWDTTPSEAST